MLPEPGKCVGFARTYKLLANAVGLKCGFREDGAHMWNAVYVDGEDMVIDASTIGTSADLPWKTEGGMSALRT